MEDVVARRTYDRQREGELIVCPLFGTKLMEDEINAMVFCIGIHRSYFGEEQKQPTSQIAYSCFVQPNSRFNRSGMWVVPSSWRGKASPGQTEDMKAIYAVTLKAVVEILKVIGTMLMSGDCPFIKQFVVIVPGPSPQVVEFLTRTCLMPVMRANTMHWKGGESVVPKDHIHLSLCMDMLQRLERLEQDGFRVLFEPGRFDRMGELANELAVRVFSS